MDTIKVTLADTKMIAHRGVSGLEMENTAAAFVAAGNRSYFGVECDIHVTLDKKIVVIHDSNTARVALNDTELTVEDMTFDELRELKLKNFHGEVRRDNIIPTLAEYVDICKRYGKICVIELKNRFAPEDIRLVVDELEEIGYLDGVIFISFSWENMVCLRELLPNANLQFLCNDVTDEIIDNINRYSMDIDVRHISLTHQLVEKLHNNGRLINCWTVDDPERAKELAEWGVDFITSNILE